MGFPQFEGGMGGAIALGPCGMCHQVTEFDPVSGPMVLIDPQTGRPADVTADNKLVPLADVDPAAIERSVREPLCPRCIKALNDAYRALGMVAPFPDPAPEDLT